MKSQPSVFLVEDDPGIREVIKIAVKTAGLPIESYPTADEFLKVYVPDRTGCLIADVRLPGLSGLELQELLRDKGSTLPVILTSAYGDVATVVRAMRNGAVDFLEKPFDMQALLDRIQQALRQDAVRRKAKADQTIITKRIGQLSRREREVFERIVIGMANKQVAADLCIKEKTVEGHRARIMEKMNAESLAQLVRMALQSGMIEGKP